MSARGRDVSGEVSVGASGSTSQDTVFYRAVGPADGIPVLVGLPLMASHTDIFGAESQAVLDGYLDQLTDAYRVILVDYPNIGRSSSPPPDEMTAERVCSDYLAVADALGVERFVYWGYSWGGAAGLQLASRTTRLAALVIGGWPPLGGQYRDILEAARRQLDDPSPSSRVVLREAAQYRQWVTFYESVLEWPEAEAVRAFECPRMVFFGELGDVDPGGENILIASTLRSRRSELEELGWRVHEFPGREHSVCVDPATVVPPVRAFLDDVFSGPAGALGSQS